MEASASLASGRISASSGTEGFGRRGSKGKRVKAATVSRLQMIEYLNVRAWWRNGQFNLFFTTVLWGSFVMIVWLRTDVEAAYEVNASIERHIQSIVAEPSLSGVPPNPIEKTPVPCRCACQGANRGLPPGPCGGRSVTGEPMETIDFLGEVTLADAVRLGLQAGGSGSMCWDGIRSSADALFWVQHGLLPAVWRPRNSRTKKTRAGLLLGKNLVIGGVRARQERAKALPKCEVVDTLIPYYPPGCRSADPEEARFGPALEVLGNSTAAKAAFAPVQDEPGMFDAMMDIEKPMSEAMETIKLLATNNWVDDMTRTLELGATLLNPEVGTYAFLVIKFTFPAAGSVEKTVRVRSFSVIDATLQWQDFLPELVWVAMLVLLVRQELWQILVECYHCRLGEYITDLWNVLDWLSIGVGVPVAFYWLLIALLIAQLSDDVLAIPRAPFTNVDDATLRDKWGTVLADVELILWHKMYHMFIMFFYTTLLTFRFLKNFMTQQKLSMIQLALASAFVDVCHFLLIFVVTFANFALGGRILFGAVMLEWSSFTRSIGTSLRVLMGHFDFDSMYAIAPVTATIWFWVFLLSMIFVLSNVLLAIIADHFKTFRALIGPTKPILRDAALGWRDFCWRCEWRKENCKDGEYCEVIANPYGDLLESLMEKSEVDESMRRASRQNSLGFRIARKNLENSSVKGLAEEGHPGGKPTDTKEIRYMGIDPMTANDLYDQCKKFVADENKPEMSALDQMRHMVKIIEEHNVILQNHLTDLEETTEADKDELWQALKHFEVAVRKTVDNFTLRHDTGVHSWAPPLPGRNQYLVPIRDQGQDNEYQTNYQTQQGMDFWALEDTAMHPAIADT